MLLPTKEQLQERVRARAQQGCHFMPPALLANQLATLELPPAPHDFFYCLPGALPHCGAQRAGCHTDWVLALEAGPSERMAGACAAAAPKGPPCEWLLRDVPSVGYRHIPNCQWEPLS